MRAWSSQTSAWERLARTASRVVASSLVLTACSCSSVTRPVAATSQDPFLDAPAEVRAASRGAPPQAASRRVAARSSSPEPGARGSQVAQASHQEIHRGTPAADRAVQRVSGEARMTLACPPCPQGCCPEEGYFPDEYLCDGGDRELPVHYEFDAMRGLETEDTVVEYRDEDGRRRVKPSSKVCIYAPRFAALVDVSGPIEDVGGAPPVEAAAAVQGLGLRNREAVVAQEQRAMTERLVARSRSSGLVTDVSADALDRPDAANINEHTAVAIEAAGFLRTGQVLGREVALIERRVQAAAVWTRNQNPFIASQSDGAQELRSAFNASELVGQENRFNGKSRLRIVKLADRDVAAPGDVVTFTIRFDNIGDQAVRNVVIVDNLTPRLEYVEDSGTLDRDGRLVTDDNGEGSLILRWELESPLAGRTGGVATFQARVR